MLNFYLFHLIIDDKLPEVQDLKTVFDEKKEGPLQDKETWYTVQKEIVDDKFFWLYLSYGNRKPYNEKVYNSETKIEEDNPRKNTQIEPNQQTFGLYSTDEKRLYLSDRTKKSFIENYLQEELCKSVIFKPLYLSSKEFLEKVDSIKKIRFVAYSSLFSEDDAIGEIFSKQQDMLGLDMLEEYLLEAKFGNAKNSKNFRKKFRKMDDLRKDNQIKSLMCVGHDDKGFEMIFNTEGFSQKFSIQVDKNGQGMYAPTKVRDALIQAVRR